MTRDKQRAHQALAQGGTLALLAVVFHRLYTLRNQLVRRHLGWLGQPRPTEGLHATTD